MAYSRGGHRITNTDIDSRVVRLETSVTQQSGEIRDVATRLDRLADRIDKGLQKLGEDLAMKARPQWNVLIMAGSLILAIISLAGGGALAFQSAGVASLNALTTAKFSEVETQFRGVNKEIQTQIDNNKDATVRGRDESDKMKNRIDILEESVARNTQKLYDHDNYLWPLVQSLIGHNDFNVHRQPQDQPRP